MQRRTMCCLLLGAAWLSSPVRAQEQQLAAGPVILLIGVPGSGKTVQAAQLSKKLGIPAISIADLLSQGMGKKTPTAKALGASIANGELVSDEAANDLMRDRLSAGDAGRGFILDGYPVTVPQAQFLDKLIQEQGLSTPRVVVLEATDDVVRPRMQRRKRADDDSATIDRRIQEYRQSAAFLRDWYKPENMLRADATKPVPQVTAQIVSLIEQAMQKRSFSTR